jgi:hypothetical protein
VTLRGLLAGAGRREQAERLVRPIYDWFTEGLDEPDMRAARELIGPEAVRS